MALTPVREPSFAGERHQSKAYNGLLSIQAFKKPIWDDILMYTAQKWWMQTFFEKYCYKKKPIAGDTWNWVEFGKFYQKNIINSDADVTLVSAGIFDIVLGDASAFFVVRDRIDLGILNPTAEGMNIQGEVIEVGVTGGGQPTIRVKLVDPSGTLAPVITDSAAHWAANHQLTLLYTAFGECWTVPAPRVTNPNQYSAALTKIVNTFAYCDDARNQGIWFKNSKGGYYLVPEQERIEQIRHRMLVDNALIYGQASSSVENGLVTTTGDGIIPTLNKRSMIRRTGGAIVEGDFQDLLADLGLYAQTKSFHLFAGNKLYNQAHRALAAYFKDGAIHIVQNGKLVKTDNKGSGSRVGINVARYIFGDKELSLYEYQGFSDPDFLPDNAGIGLDYGNFGVILGDVKESIGICYKKQAVSGKAVKDFVFHRTGPGMKAGGEFSASSACMEIVYETHVGVEVKGGNSHALLIGG